MPKSKLNIWIQNNNLDSQWLEASSRFPKHQIEKLLNEPHFKPDGTTMRITLSIVKKTDVTAKLSDFWDV
ncbi:hypothetical protein RFW18_20530 [Metabacillus idriensis]|uniref:hypothetical protein n=1 Tax=Metabacillus idriensis TaxID=324768 RepID=UPI0028145714|nr:hypothetical protein [Metabacillus idriensis]MDR0140153.1 hypothetical protein [Metabacillus idriensis]